MTSPGKADVKWLTIGDESAGQRLDNFLAKTLKGVPRSHIYRLLRGGEVRVNSRRADAAYKLEEGDRLRIPPVRVGEKTSAPGIRPEQVRGIEQAILYRDEVLLALDKPTGLAVHGGSGISLGVIEQLRQVFPHQPFMELVHRLDKETSGILLVALKRSALTRLHHSLREGKVGKRYLALVAGDWKEKQRHVRLPLHKFVNREGERRVLVSDEGKAAHTIFRLLRTAGGFSLLDAELRTGRTHQIRVHLAHLGYPILGDEKYGDFALNRSLKSRGLRRMFLHAAHLAFDHPASGAAMELDAPLPSDLKAFLDNLGIDAAF
jgi:23S rRNA pseudouridine955/2504/2580 synthase